MDQLSSFGPELMKIVVQALIAGAATFAAVKVELRYIREGIKHSVRKAEEAHARVDRHLESHAAERREH